MAEVLGIEKLVALLASPNPETLRNTMYIIVNLALCSGNHLMFILILFFFLQKFIKRK